MHERANYSWRSCAVSVSSGVGEGAVLATGEEDIQFILLQVEVKCFWAACETFTGQHSWCRPHCTSWLQKLGMLLNFVSFFRACLFRRSEGPDPAVECMVTYRWIPSLVQPGGSVLSLTRPGVWVGVLVFLYRLIFPWLFCITQSLCLSQKSGSGFGDDAPVLQDVICSGELWGHRESDDAFGVNVCRDEVHGARPGQSPQQLLGQSISSLE